MMLKYIPLAAACFILSSPATAQIYGPSPVPTPASNAKSDKPKLICEYQEETGSRLDRKRICHTAEEWQAIKAQSREAIEKFQQQNTGTPTSG